MTNDGPRYPALVIVVSLIAAVIVGGAVGWLLGGDLKSSMMTSLVVAAVGLFLAINPLKWGR